MVPIFPQECKAIDANYSCCNRGYCTLCKRLLHLAPTCVVVWVCVVTWMRQCKGVLVLPVLKCWAFFAQCYSARRKEHFSRFVTATAACFVCWAGQPYKRAGLFCNAVYRLWNVSLHTCLSFNQADASLTALPSHYQTVGCHSGESVSFRDDADPLISEYRTPT